MAGQKTALFKTTHFQNTRAEMLACFFKRGAGQFRVHARRTSQREFSAILRSMAFEEAA